MLKEKHMSREKFEAIYGPMGFDLTRWRCAAPEPWSQYKDEKTGYAWAGWLAGRESMRDEAWEKVNSIITPGVLSGNGADKAAQRNGIILASNLLINIEP